MENRTLSIAVWSIIAVVFIFALVLILSGRIVGMA